jgi:hypothetical protein
MPDPELTAVEQALVAAGEKLVADHNWLARVRARKDVDREELHRAREAVSESDAVFKRALAEVLDESAGVVE